VREQALRVVIVEARCEDVAAAMFEKPGGGVIDSRQRQRGETILSAARTLITP